MPQTPRPLFAATTLACALLGFAAQAAEPATATATAPQTAASAPMSKGERKAIREFQMLDFNGDGKLSRKEVAFIPKLAAAFNEADTNKDNYVTLDEVRAFTVKYRAERDRAKAAAAAKTAAEPMKTTETAPTALSTPTAPSAPSTPSTDPAEASPK